jgi:prepilin-type N-terminal cleavage/methylation domain-containing protein
MNDIQTRRGTRGFTLVELLVAVMVLGLLSVVALPSYLVSINGSRQISANANARSLASAIQATLARTGKYGTALSSYENDLGGSIPVNPCTGTSSGYTLTATGSTLSVSADPGTNCGTWTPESYAVERK